MKESGICEVEVLPFDPKESVSPKDAERELRLSAKWAEEAFGPFSMKVDFNDFWKEVGQIVRKEGRVYGKVILLLGRKKAIAAPPKWLGR